LRGVVPLPENSPKYAKFSFFEFASRSGAKKVVIFEFSSQIDAKKVATLRERVLFRRIQLGAGTTRLKNFFKIANLHY
jgi:hypothetical protein